MHIRSLFAATLLVGALTFAPINAQIAPQQHPASTPYTGDLSIFETPGRAQRLHIDRVMDLLHITPGRTVADIGAGGGWFSVIAAPRVGATGTVLAEDLHPQYIDAL